MKIHIGLLGLIVLSIIILIIIYTIPYLLLIIPTIILIRAFMELFKYI